MPLRHSTRLCAALGTVVLIASSLAAHGLIAVSSAAPILADKAALVRTLHLTDLCLFTEASYTRHLAMADLNTPFQDSPLAMEHFPTGSLVAPPRHLTAPAATRMTVRKHGSNP